MSPASRAAPCRRPYRPGCRAESPGPVTRARAHADAGRNNASGCYQPIVVHRRWRHTRTGRRRQRQRQRRRRPARIAMPCSPASRSTIVHVGRRSRSVSPVQAGVGVTRLMTAGGAATSRVGPAFNPTVGGVTGTNPRYGNRSRRRTSQAFSTVSAGRSDAGDRREGSSFRSASRIPLLDIVRHLSHRLSAVHEAPAIPAAARPPVHPSGTHGAAVRDVAPPTAAGAAFPAAARLCRPFAGLRFIPAPAGETVPGDVVRM